MTHKKIQLVYTVWACLKAMNKIKEIKRKMNKVKINFDDNYNSSIDDTIILHFSIFQFFETHV